MSQTSLFDAGDLASAALPLAVAGSRPALSKAQKRFNDLIAKVELQRQLLQQWRDYLPAHYRRVHAEVTPLTARLRERRIGMVMLLDQALGGKTLAKTHRAKAIDVLLGLLSEVLREAPDPELVRVYDKYSEQSFADEQREGMEITKSIAGSMFGVDLDDDDEPPSSPEVLAERIAMKMQAAQAERAQRSAKARKPSAKMLAREQARAQADEGASRALREVYRKLASELHPDRETDPVLRTQKTAAMQKANQAYEARDLLALLELQMGLAQIDPTALAGMAQERLAHYNLVLEEQLLRLQEELADVTGPFLMALGGRMPRSATPAFVARALDEDIAHMQASVHEIEADLETFRDPKQLKAFLRQHRIGGFDDDGMDAFESMLMAQAMQRRR
ncbi:MAG: J domain-containing protein [Burkholderiales bacterium]